MATTDAIEPEYELYLLSSLVFWEAVSVVPSTVATVNPLQRMLVIVTSSPTKVTVSIITRIAWISRLTGSWVERSGADIGVAESRSGI